MRASYEADTGTYFGAIVGRYGNRLAKGTFSIDGTAYHVPINNNGNSRCMGGRRGSAPRFGRRGKFLMGVEMSLVSPDGDMGFPGDADAEGELFAAA